MCLKRIRSSVVMLGLIALASVALGDTPHHPYTVKLGPGNKDLEQQIHAIPWTPHPDHSSYRVKEASHVDFSGRDLRLAEIHFELHALRGANFANCKLDGSSLMETEFSNCSFQQASLRYCEMDSFSDNSRFFNDFTDADITGSWLHALPGQSLEQTKNFREKRFVGTEIRSLMKTQDFSGFEFIGTKMILPVQGCDFSGASFERTMIVFDNMSKEQVYSTANYSRRDFSQVLFCRWNRQASDFTGWDFSDCNLAYFLNCDLADANFHDSFFVKTKADQVSNPTSSVAFGVRGYYTMARLADVGFDGCTVSEAQLAHTANWKQKYLRNMHLQNMPLDGWDFSGMNMKFGNLSRSSLKGTNFRGADIEGLQLEKCRGLSLKQLEETKTFAGSSRNYILESYPRTNFADLSNEEMRIQETLRKRP